MFQKSWQVFLTGSYTNRFWPHDIGDSKFKGKKIKALALLEKTDLRVLTRTRKSTRGKQKARSESSQTLAMDEDEQPSVYSHLKDFKNLKQLLEK